MGVRQPQGFNRILRDAKGTRGWLHFITLLAVVGMLLCLPRRTAENEAATVYFFSSESSINNFNMLKGEFDWFFSSAGNHKFQPFRNRADFENVLNEKPAGLCLMSSWYFARLPDKSHWRPVLIGQRKQSSTQRHVLSARESVTEWQDLRGKTIAAAGSREFALELLQQMLPPDDQSMVKSFKILTVPKDIDALMSVGFGVAAAAITTETGLERLAKLNPRQHEKLGRIATGPEQLLPVIAAPVEPNVACDELRKVLLGMGTDPDGQPLLSMLGLDGWRAIEPEHLEVLLK